MQAVGGAVEPDIGDDHALAAALVERLAVGHLVDEAAILHGGDEVGGGSGHAGLSGMAAGPVGGLAGDAAL
jgi:hypothetical protein